MPLWQYLVAFVVLLGINYILKVKFFNLVLKAQPIGDFIGKLIAFYKIVNKKAPQYLIDY